MFEDWETGQPDNFNQREDCTQIITTDCRQNICGWNDAPCTFTSSSRGDVLRPICKQEQTVWDHLYIMSE